MGLLPVLHMPLSVHCGSHIDKKAFSISQTTVFGNHSKGRESGRKTQNLQFPVRPSQSDLTPTQAWCKTKRSWALRRGGDSLLPACWAAPCCALCVSDKNPCLWSDALPLIICSSMCGLLL